MQLSGLMRDIGLPHDDGWNYGSSWGVGFVGVSIVGAGDAENLANRLSSSSSFRRW